MTKQYQIRPGYSLFARDLDHVDHVVGADWESLRGAHVFVTGGTGFFGIWLVESLLWANEYRRLGLTVTVLSRDPEAFLRIRAAHLAGREDLSFASGSMTRFVDPELPVTHIIHAASETNLEATSDWPQRFLAGALDGTRRILDLAASHGVTALLLTTSGAVYGQSDVIVNGRCVEGPAGTADLVSEKAVYGQAKRMMEIMSAVEGKVHNYRAVIARCFAFVGPYLPLDSNYAIGNFIRDALQSRDIVVSGDGTPLRSYLYAADLAAWLLVMLIRGKAATPYNVGGERALSISDLALLVNLQAKGAGKVLISKRPDPATAPHAYLPSLDRIASDLGLQVAIDVEDAVSRTLTWHRIRMVERSGSVT